MSQSGFAAAIPEDISASKRHNRGMLLKGLVVTASLAFCVAAVVAPFGVSPSASVVAEPRPAPVAEALAEPPPSAGPPVSVPPSAVIWGELPNFWDDGTNGPIATTTPDGTVSSEATEEIAPPERTLEEAGFDEPGAFERSNLFNAPRIAHGDELPGHYASDNGAELPSSESGTDAESGKPLNEYDWTTPGEAEGIDWDSIPGKADPNDPLSIVELKFCGMDLMAAEQQRLERIRLGLEK